MKSAKEISNASYLKIVREEVQYSIFSVRIPTNAPWSKSKHAKHVCENGECGKSFDPKRWFSRFCSRSCYSKVYSAMYRNWRKRQERFYLRR